MRKVSGEEQEYTLQQRKKKQKTWRLYNISLCEMRPFCLSHFECKSRFYLLSTIFIINIYMYLLLFVFVYYLARHHYKCRSCWRIPTLSLLPFGFCFGAAKSHFHITVILKKSFCHVRFASSSSSTVCRLAFCVHVFSLSCLLLPLLDKCSCRLFVSHVVAFVFASLLVCF